MTWCSIFIDDMHVLQSTRKCQWFAVCRHVEVGDEERKLNSDGVQCTLARRLKFITSRDWIFSTQYWWITSLWDYESTITYQILPAARANFRTVVTVLLFQTISSSWTNCRTDVHMPPVGGDDPIEYDCMRINCFSHLSCVHRSTRQLWVITKCTKV